MNKTAIIYIFLVIALFGGVFFATRYYFSSPIYTIATSVDVVIPTKLKKESLSGIKPLTQEDLKIFFEAWRTLNENYTKPPVFKTDLKEKNEKSQEEGIKDESDKTSHDYIFNAIQGLITTIGDPYTVLLPEEKSKEFSSEVIDGEIDGIGVYLGKRNGVTTIIAPLEGSPAKKAGLRAGDIILTVDKKKMSVKSINEVVNMIRGKRGSEVEIKIFRPSTQEEKTKKITRQHVSVPSVKTTSEREVFIVKVSNFTKQTSIDFKKAMDIFVKEGYDKLIIDMRDNPGGVLDVAVYMAGFFIPEKKPVLYEYKGSNALTGYYVRGLKPIKNIEDKDIVVLINGGSASASEIFAGALNVYGRATLIGESTYGKGSIQRIIPLSDGSLMKVTHAYWLLPDKTTVSINGIEPDILIEGGDKETAEKEDLTSPLDINTNDIFIKKAMSHLR